MSGSVVQRRGWWIGSAAGVVVAVGVVAGSYVQQQAEGDPYATSGGLSRTATRDVPPPVDTVRALLAQDSPLAVHPDLVDTVDPKALRQAREVLEEAGQSPVRRVAYVPWDTSVHSGFTPSGAMAQWMDGVGEDGHYVMVFQGGSFLTGAIGLDDQYLRSGAEGQPGPALLRVATEVAQWPAESRDGADGADRAGDDGELPLLGELALGTLAGGVLATLTVLPAFWGVRSRRKHRRTREG